MDFSRIQQALRAGCVDLWAAGVHWKDAPSPPPAPDYAKAATATNESSRVNQYTPYGSQVYTPGSPAQEARYDPMTGAYIPASAGTPWSSTTTLAPQAQQALDAQMAASAGMGQLGVSQMGRVNQQYSKPMDSSSVQDVSDKAYGAMTSRLDPQWQQAETMQKTQLANQGLTPGGEAYDNAMRVFNQGKNDAYQQANLGAIGTMPQTYQLESSIYNQPLNTLNAIRSGAQIQNPSFGATGTGANMLGAAQAQGQYAQGLYGAQVGETNAQNANTTQGVAAAAAIAAMMF